MFTRHRYSIGIDLGTSNCVLAYVDLQENGQPTHILEIPQWENWDRSVLAQLLPSFAYYPTSNELQNSAPVGWEKKHIVGLLARGNAALHPDRVVHSAKSWLIHAGVDRESPILPWQSEEIKDSEKISPVEASALYLSYLRAVWDQTIAAGDDAKRFDRQEIVVTVPASFDQDAQKLTLEACALAGYPQHVRLLEEPQAAFYAWMERHAGPQTMRTALAAPRESTTHHVLVVDIGGGTTDLSLFAVKFSTDELPDIERVAVSEHILLGGDNIDLAIGRILENQAGGDGKLSVRAWQKLVNLCRDLKERILAEPETDDREYRVAIGESGSALFTSARTIAVRHRSVVELVNDGFFQPCNITDKPRTPSAGLREAGLPYAHDTSVMRHLAAFLDGKPPIDSLLCNGGTLMPLYLQKRIADQISVWQNGRSPKMLTNDELYLAVARGAALFGRDVALHRHQLIIAGASHGFYLEFSPDTEKKATYLTCVLPLGTAVEEPQRITKLKLMLRVNQPVEFRAYSSVKRFDDHTGQILKQNETDFKQLPPLQTVARFEHANQGLRAASIPVTIEARLNALGLLRVFLVAVDSDAAPATKGRQWELEFNLRAVVNDTQQGSTGSTTLVEPIAESDKAHAFSLLSRPFGPGVLKDLEESLGIPREKWNRIWLRELWKPIFDTITRRAQSPEYEAAWLNAAGYFLRPGYGVALDDFRIEQLWNAHELGLAHPDIKSVREQWYIMWRRVSGGLDTVKQMQLYNEYLALVRTHTKQALEPIRMLAAFERLPTATKQELFNELLEGIRKTPPKRLGPYLWALGRLLSRVPLYAGEESVLSPTMVEQCYSLLKDFDWRAPGLEYTPTLFALACRKTNSRFADIAPILRTTIVERLKASQARKKLIRQVETYVPMEQEDFNILFGESLPSGLSTREF